MAAAKTPPSANKIARILVDADELGDEGAARKHGVSVRSVQRYRAKHAPLSRDLSPDLSGVAGTVAALKETIIVDWLEGAREARRELLGRVMTLARETDSLRDAAGALKIVHDAVLAEEMLRDGGQPIDRARMGGSPRPSTPMASFAARHGVQ